MRCPRSPTSAFARGSRPSVSRPALVAPSSLAATSPILARAASAQPRAEGPAHSPQSGWRRGARGTTSLRPVRGIARSSWMSSITSMTMGRAALRGEEPRSDYQGVHATTKQGRAAYLRPVPDPSFDALTIPPRMLPIAGPSPPCCPLPPWRPPPLKPRPQPAQRPRWARGSRRPCGSRTSRRPGPPRSRRPRRPANSFLGQNNSPAPRTRLQRKARR